MSVTVVDTNVILVANGQHADVSPACVTACVLALQSVMNSGKLVLDDGFRILLEYQNRTQPKKGNRPGDAFVKWALNNQRTRKHVDQVTLLEHGERGFESFPDDTELMKFDASDRKFVAASSAHPGKPPIAQAADSKWLDWAPALKRHGIEVTFLCQPDIQRLHTPMTTTPYRRAACLGRARRGAGCVGSGRTWSYPEFVFVKPLNVGLAQKRHFDSMSFKCRCPVQPFRVCCLGDGGLVWMRTRSCDEFPI